MTLVGRCHPVAVCCTGALVNLSLQAAAAASVVRDGAIYGRNCPYQLRMSPRPDRALAEP